MKKEKVSYSLSWYTFHGRKVIHARREVPYEVTLASRLVLDELMYTWNKNHLESLINEAIDQGDRDRFVELSERYKPYTYE
ncbi:hypothetical protein N781_14670 [Pontibacillus halophilus JSM 076056 = DSM 19796]|uniref:IDEAL domain-containing protein n=1 Tax=Pontibacillus halophilus JSM 076056 = DSM 19796 TaxID=1385510 RepID=A0A0A5GKT5_9BACI|nr:IDEAL domain-containing protein [Pontibacillus halophilus]KGX92574.1 hypothetical protein N781_14670 [Pontibacillus halophilus JSM 076056 = DSM 19796]